MENCLGSQELNCLFHQLDNIFLDILNGLWLRQNQEFIYNGIDSLQFRGNNIEVHGISAPCTVFQKLNEPFQSCHWISDLMGDSRC
ncbi:Uncharacterised protein [Mycobacteroides abscessus subsp. abscessus]|nr:Uncharacterised protein [Mycobacteroides abscessus subsp. abscessus]